MGVANSSIEYGLVAPNMVVYAVTTVEKNHLDRYREFRGKSACGDASGGGTTSCWSTSHASLKQEANAVYPVVG
jgi:hypothetical protein